MISTIAKQPNGRLVTQLNDTPYAVPEDGLFKDQALIIGKKVDILSK